MWDFLDKLVAEKKPASLPPPVQPRSKFTMPPVPVYKKLVGVDTETHLITPACQTPPMVCATFYDGVTATILGGTEDDKREAVMRVWHMLHEDDTCLVGLNGYYDWAVLIREAARWFGESFSFKFSYKLYTRMKAGYVRELSIIAKLLYIRMDWLDFDPIIGRQPTFSLAELVHHWFRVELEGKKGDDVWRLRYHELDEVPVSMWPEAAVNYALMDAVWAQKTYDLLATTYGHSPDEIFQTVKGWAMYNSGLWGMHLDEAKINDLENKLLPIVTEAKAVLISGGMYGGPGDTNPTDDKFFDTPRQIAGGLIREKPPEILHDKVIAYLESIAVAPLKRTPGGKPSFAAGAIKPYMQDKVIFAYVNKNVKALLATGYAKPAGYSKNMKAIRTRVTEWFTSRGEEVPMGDESEITQQKNVKTDREVLQSTDDPDLRLLAAIGQFDTVLSTFIPAFRLGVGHGVHPRWNPLVSTGRPSVSSPNLNNQPKLKGVRECFVARPGYVLVSADYKQAELCSLAQINLNLFGFSDMARAICEGKDLHAVVGAQLMGVSYEEFLSLLEAGDEDAGFYRQLAKIANFGFPGGQGIDSFMRFARKAGVVLNREQVVNLKAGWQSSYTEMVSYFEWINKQIQNGRPTGAMRNGRPVRAFDLVHQYTGRVRGKVKFTDGCNSGFQGLTADGGSNAYISIFEECTFDTASPLFGSGIDAWIYDEFLVEIPYHSPEQASAAAERLAQIMKEKMEELTPDVPATVDPAMMIHWSKKAKLVRNEKGLIIPWETTTTQQ